MLIHNVHDTRFSHINFKYTRVVQFVFNPLNTSNNAFKGPNKQHLCTSTEFLTSSRRRTSSWRRASASSAASLATSNSSFMLLIFFFKTSNSVPCWIVVIFEEFLRSQRNAEKNKRAKRDKISDTPVRNDTISKLEKGVLLCCHSRNRNSSELRFNKHRAADCS